MTATNQAVWNRQGIVNSTILGPQTNGQVAALGTGGFAVVWVDGSGTYGAGGTAVIGQIFDVLGNKVGGEFRISATTTGDKHQPAIASRPDGGFAVAYTDRHGGGADIFVRIYDRYGSLVRQDAVETSIATTDAPTISSFGDGGYIVSYRLQVSNTETDVVGRMVNPAGFVGMPFNVYDGVTRALPTDSATSADGSVVVAYHFETGLPVSLFSVPSYVHLWSRSPDGAITDRLLTSGFDGSVAAIPGGAFGASFNKVSLNDAGVFRTPSGPNPTTGGFYSLDSRITGLAGGDEGTMLVVWNEDVGRANPRVLAQAFDVSGPLGGAWTIRSGALPETASDVATLLDGRVVVVSDVPVRIGGDGNDSGVVHRFIDAHHLPIRMGDFDGNGKADLLFANRSQPDFRVTTMDGLSYAIGGAPIAHNPSFRIVGVGDIDGDGKDDVLWRHKTDGSLVYTLMDGLQPKLGGSLGVVNQATWQVAALDDFNGDGKADILWYYAGWDVPRAITYLNGAAFEQTVYFAVTTDRVFLAAGDIDGDGRADLLYRHKASDNLFVTLANGLDASPGTVSQSFSFQALDDFDGDGKDDILWRNLDDGTMFVTFMNGTVFKAGAAPGGSSLALHVAGTGDFNGDGKADVFWRGNDASAVAPTYVTLMNGGEYMAGGSPGSISANYNIVGDQHAFLM